MRLPVQPAATVPPPPTRQPADRPEPSLAAWEAAFEAGLVADSARSTPEPWLVGRVYVVDAPPQPEFVPTSAGYRHQVLLFTSGVRRTEERIPDRPAHVDGPLAPGDVLVYSAETGREDHLTRWATRIRFLTLAIEPGDVARAAGALGRDYAATEFVDRFPARDPLLEGVVRALGSEVEAGGPSGRLYAEGLVQAVAVHLVAKHTAVPVAVRPTGGLPAAALRRARSYVHEHLAADISLADLAGAAGYSEYHFCRAFKESTGEAPYAYVQRLRVEEAARLLRETEWGVAAVALAVGYESPSRLATLFRRRFGVSPSTYRRGAR